MFKLGIHSGDPGFFFILRISREIHDYICKLNILLKTTYDTVFSRGAQ